MEKAKTGKLATEENKHKIFDYSYDFLIFERLNEFEKTELEPEEIIELKRVAKAYADTGLTPEGIKRLIKMFEIRGELLNACSIEGVIFNDVRCYKEI